MVPTTTSSKRGDGNDWIHGGLGNDEMQGEGGNDTIYGGQDNGKIFRDLTTGKLTELVIGDNLYGNDGQDTYYYAQGDGIDLIWDFRPGEDVIKISGFNPQDVKVTFVRGVTNRIGTPGHDKLALFFGNDAGAIVFNDFPGPKAGDVILDFGTSQLTWFDLLSIAIPRSEIRSSAQFRQDRARTHTTIPQAQAPPSSSAAATGTTS